MNISKEEVLYIANLARLNINDSEAESFTKEMEDMIGFANMLSQIDTGHAEPADYIMKLQNVFREDIAEESYERDALLENAPAKQDGYYLVPKTV